jgi:PAS domain S-box-containing protein
MIGYTQDEFSRLTLSDFTHPDDLEANMMLVRRARDGEIDRYQLEKRYVHKDGHVVWGLTSAAVVRDQAGQPAYFVVHVEDITQRKQLERQREEALLASEAWFHTLTNTAPVLVWVSGPDGLVTFVNLPWLQFTGRTLEQELGDGWAEGVHPDDHDRCLRTYRAAFDARQPFTMEYRLRRADGTYRWLVDTGVPRFAPDGAFLGYIGSVIDISDRLQLEQEREEARATALAEREANAQMDAFLGLVSHELKQPLTVMSTSIQLTQRRLGRLAAAPAAPSLPELEAQIAPLQKELIRTGQQVEYQDGLINELLDAARVRAGKFAIYPEPANLLPLVESAVDEQRLLTPRRVIGLDLPDVESIPVQADARHIKQVVTNYLTNALKYSPAACPVEVGVTSDGAQARVWVRDQGPGLAPDQQQRVFERFYRAPDIAVQSDAGIGLGLGLYICRSIIEQHGGQVGVESVPRQGCTFWFTLPPADTAVPST